MSILPDPRPGWFNLWLLMILYMLPMLATLMYRQGIFRATSSRFSHSRSAREKKLFILSKLLMLAYLLYAIVIPIRLETSIAIIGLIIFIAGFALYMAAWVTIAKSEQGEVLAHGPFRFSRHPVYLASALLFVGAGCISQSWFFLGFSIVVGLSHMHNALAEERICVETFGDEYRRYMSRTPRWIGKPDRKQNSTYDFS